jgi:GNAT superfamily N-acetyltransferase
MLPSPHIRPAESSDVAHLHEIRREAICRLSLTHLSESEAAEWACRGGIPRVARAVANDQVWVAARGPMVVGWLHRAANSIEGLYVSPLFARQRVGTALVLFAEGRMAQEGHPRVVLESSLNAVEFYLRLGFAVTGARCASGSVPMRKEVVGASGGT